MTRPFALALAAAVALVVLSATARPGADQPTTSPDPMTYQKETDR